MFSCLWQGFPASSMRRTRRGKSPPRTIEEQRRQDVIDWHPGPSHPLNAETVYKINGRLDVLASRARDTRPR